MLKKSLFLTLAAAAMAVAAHADNTITWQTLGNSADSTGSYYIQRFTIEADAPFERMAFCQFKRPMTVVDSRDTLLEIIPGYFAVASPRFAEAGPGNPVTVDVRVRGALRNVSYRADGMHLVADGKAVPARNVLCSTVERPEQYVYNAKDGLRDPMIYGPQAFAINDSLRTAVRPGAYGEIPTLKSVTFTGGKVKRPAADKVTVVPVSDTRSDYFRADICGEELTVSTNSATPDAVVALLMRRIDNAADAYGMVPSAVIEDWADMDYRAFMLDVVRNFLPADGVKTIIDIMADYGLNVLHMHLADDEGWRVEIPELPELTLVGSRRGYTVTDDVPFLKQIYSGDGDPLSTTTPANGYYTRDEFIDLLRYARSKGIDIIPEFDTPGHSRAAIRAMEYRYRTTGDDMFRLIHDGDSSRYTTAQDYHDNIMNPALDGPYRLWDTVINSVANIYGDAGVPLRAIHIGGDEVPAHAWDGSHAANALMAAKGMTHQRDLHAFFVKRVAEIAAWHGVKIAGWQEIALDHSADYDKAVQPVVAYVNCWTNAGKYGAQMAEKGYPLILSNVDYLYFDQTPDTHPEEPGLTWGGLVDEFRPLHATVDVLCPGPADVQANVAGISATLFAETVRSQAMVERYLLPRILGLAERAHNIAPTVADDAYFGAITAEMPRWAADGRDFYLRQPGIVIADGIVTMNDAYGAGEIRYTTDGSDPTPDSALYTAPFALPADATQVRARLFYGPAAKSVTSILYLDK